MHVTFRFSAWALAICLVLTEARFGQFPERRNPDVLHGRRSNLRKKPLTSSARKCASNIISQNANTTKFAVNGSAIPAVDFDVGESYAGLLPISGKADESRELYFWFFPSNNVNATDEIVIWLNGGPGCSSLEGFFQENGPVLWQYGTYQPVRNPWTWVQLSNMVWVEQPVGTGFTQGVPTATNEAEAAVQFLGFWKNFVDTFALHGRKVYIAGESYAGYYVPYITDAMLSKNDTTYYNAQAFLIYDPCTSLDVVQQQIPAVPFVDYWAPLFNLNGTFIDDLHRRADECGYTEFLNTHLIFPPSGLLPTPPNVDGKAAGCDLWSDIYGAVALVNPCFDVYHVTTTCPLLWDVLGLPGSFGYVPDGAAVYFNRTDVQRAINAPVQPWAECSPGVFAQGDDSPPSALSILPRVIERTNGRSVIAHGTLDFLLIANGTLLAIQNMTWNGAQGFLSPPVEPFIVPYHHRSAAAAASAENNANGDNSDQMLKGALAAAGVMGIAHTERGLTWVEVAMAGHMVPQYAPSAAYRQLEFVLGRIDSLSEHGGRFSTQLDR